MYSPSHPQQKNPVSNLSGAVYTGATLIGHILYAHIHMLYGSYPGPSPGASPILVLGSPSPSPGAGLSPCSSVSPGPG